MANAKAISPGPMASIGTRRNVPHHLLSTIAPVESGVATRTSRLPRWRSSDNDKGAKTDNINKPRIN